jgi:hypothetical protein
MDGMTDVATRTSWKCLVRGLFSLFFGLVVLAVAALLLYLGLFKPDKEMPWWAFLIGFTLLFLFGWFSFTDGVRRLQEAFQGGCYLRAGPNGIALRVPGNPTWSSLRLTYRMMEAELPWSKIKQYHPWVRRVNGIPTSSQVRFELAGGGWYYIDMAYFRESRQQVVANITAAAKRA